MTSESDAGTDEPRLTLDQGSLAAYVFIRLFSERDCRKPESTFNLLRWMQLEGPRLSVDPALWHDWTLCVRKALEVDQESLLSRPLSPSCTQ